MLRAGGVKRFHFSPGTLDGNPVPVKITWKQKFFLSPRTSPSPSPRPSVPLPDPVRIKGRITEAGTRAPLPHATLVAKDLAGTTLAEAESGEASSRDRRSAYTLSRSERRDGPSQAWRTFQFDQMHILTLVAGSHLPWEVDVGVRLRYATGNPEIVEGPGLYDADHDVTIPSVVGQPYSTRLPDFFALDLRIDKRFAFKKWMLMLYLDIQNLTNYKNVEGHSYSYDYTSRAPVTGLLILPSIGLRASF